MSAFAKPTSLKAALKLAFYGPAGSGKTFTALLLAEGLAPPGRAPCRRSRHRTRLGVLLTGGAQQKGSPLGL